MPERQRRSFTEDYKRQAVELAASSGRSIGSVAKELGLRDSVLRRWMDKLRQKPTAAAWRPAAPHGARHFRKVDRDLCRNPDMSFRFIEDHREAYPVRLMCAVLEVSPAGYYAWRERPVCARSSSNAALLAEIRQVHRESSQRYGSPRVHAVLRTQGRGASRGRIERLMRQHGIRAIMAPPRRVRTTQFLGGRSLRSRATRSPSSRKYSCGIYFHLRWVR